MHNRFESLLKRCKKRRRKLFLKWFLIGIASILLGVGGLLYWQKKPVGETVSYLTHPIPIKSAPTETNTSNSKEEAKKKDSHDHEMETTSVDSQKRSQEKVVIKGPKAVKRENPTKKRGTPSRPTYREVVEASSFVTLKEERNNKHSHLSKTPLAFGANKEVSSRSSKKVKPKSPAKRAVLHIKEVQDVDAMIRQYEKFPRYVTALKIANLYYEKRDYENAALWARKANLIDRDDEEAWILYTKSEYALGNRKRAMRILRLYLDYRESVKAKTLLMVWNRDEKGEEINK